MAPLPVAADHHQRHQMAGVDGGDGSPTIPLQRAVDSGDGRGGRCGRATAGLIPDFPAAHRALDRRDGAQVTRPRFSTLFALGWLLVAASLAAAAVLLDVTARPPSGKTVVTVRLWDQQVAKAYRLSCGAFTRTHPDIEVQTDVVSYSTYFNTLRTDVAGGTADIIFWLSIAYLAGYHDSGRLIDVGETFGPDIASTWESSVVQQFTRGGRLWAVPQLTDAGIALYYNADLLAAAGVAPAALTTLRWNPGGDDTLRPLLARLTVDVDGRSAGTPGFDPNRIRRWAYNAANDAQGIYLNYIGSAGGGFPGGDWVAVDNPTAADGFPLSVET